MSFENLFDGIGGLSDRETVVMSVEQMVRESRERYEEFYFRFISEPTPEELEAFEKARVFVKNLLREFGGRPEKVDGILIHTLFAGTGRSLGEDFPVAAASSSAQIILYETNERYGEIDVIDTIIHELWHLVTYHTVSFEFDDKKLEPIAMPDRQGLMRSLRIENETIKLFLSLEEAVIAELQSRAHKYFFHQSPLNETRKEERVQLDIMIKTLYDFELQGTEKKITYDKFKERFIYDLIKAQVTGRTQEIAARVDALVLYLTGESDGWNSLGYNLSS